MVAWDVKFGDFMTAVVSADQVTRTLDPLVAATHEAMRSVAADLSRSHAEPHRRYHTAEHVSEVLAEIDRLAGSLDETERATVELAALFHDAVYDVAADHGASEAASAELAVATLVELGVDPTGPTVAEVDRLIRLTVDHHVESDDRLGAVLVNADLWILSSPPERYRRYAADARAEYAHVPDQLWIVGRGAVLDRFAGELDQLYAAGPAPARAARRSPAAVNLAAERASLG